MNKALQLLMAAALVTGFAACSSDDDMLTANNFPQDGVVRFNVGVNIPQTRASHSTAGSDVAEFGICIYNKVSSKYTYNNIRVTGSNTTAWTPTQQMLWQNSTQAVDIVAYSPYVSGYYTPSSKNYPVFVEATQTTKKTTQATSLSARSRTLCQEIKKMVWKMENCILLSSTP